MQKKSCGFTLIELLVVVLIIGILVGIISSKSRNGSAKGCGRI